MIPWTGWNLLALSAVFAVALDAAMPVFGKDISGTATREKEESKAATDAGAAPPRVILQLSDGSRVVGTPSNDVLSFQTSYAKIKLPLAKIESVHFDKDHERITVNLKNDDRLQGAADFGEIQLQTLFGRVTIAVEHLALLQVTSGIQPITEGLILWLDAREFTPEKWTDKSGQSGDGISRNAEKTDDGVVLFNGKDSAITIPRKHHPKNLTVSIWAKKSGTLSTFWECIVSCGVDNDFFITMLGGSSDNAKWAGVIFTDTGTYVGGFTREIFGTRWIMFTMVYDGKALTLYQNGVLCGAIPATGTIKTMGTNYVLGHGPPEKPPYAGYLGDVLLYDRALSEEEIMRNFKVGAVRFAQP